MRLALSESALKLIFHARHEIPAFVSSARSPGRIASGPLGSTTSPKQWLPEAALLRLISVIEAYVDAVSMHRMGQIVDSSHVLVAKMLDDFELASSVTWQERQDKYKDYHRVTLGERAGWGAIKAGIEVRNCIVHGMGNLTAQQRGKTTLARTVSHIDVAVTNNRMHLSASTIPKLGAGCEDFVRDMDREIDLSHP